MMKASQTLALLGTTLMLGACATTPSGPSMNALPGSGKSFDQFRADDYDCRQYGSAQIGGNSPSQLSNESVARSAAAGTAIGAVVGAALGGRDGAAVGVGSGLLIGSVEGIDAGERSGYRAQRSYDNAYLQCMYAKGHRVPVNGRLMQNQPRPAPPPARYLPPPPPPGHSGPPPTGYGVPPGEIR